MNASVRSRGPCSPEIKYHAPLLGICAILRMYAPGPLGGALRVFPGNSAGGLKGGF